MIATRKKRGLKAVWKKRKAASAPHWFPIRSKATSRNRLAKIAIGIARIKNGTFQAKCPLRM